jgi:hypothetical protein
MNSNFMQYASPIDDNNFISSKKINKSSNNINKLNAIINANNVDSDSDSDNDEYNVINIKKNKTRGVGVEPEPFSNYNKNIQYSPVLLESSPYSITPPSSKPYPQPQQQQPMNPDSSLNDKLNYIIHLLEESKSERTDRVMEEVVLYSFLGIFIIFIVDSFSKMGKYTR